MRRRKRRKKRKRSDLCALLSSVQNSKRSVNIRPSRASVCGWKKSDQFKVEWFNSSGDYQHDLHVPEPIGGLRWECARGWWEHVLWVDFEYNSESILLELDRIAQEKIVINRDTDTLLLAWWWWWGRRFWWCNIIMWLLNKWRNCDDQVINREES